MLAGTQGSACTCGPRIPYGAAFVRSAPRLRQALASALEGSHIHEAMGKLRAVHILLGRLGFESIVRRLGIDVKDAPELAKRTDA